MVQRNVSESASSPVYLTDSSGNTLSTLTGQRGNSGISTSIAAIDEVVLDPLTSRLDALIAGPNTVGGMTVPVTVAVPVTGSGAYASGDFVGTYSQPIPLPGMGRNLSIRSGVVMTALILDKAVQSASLEIWLFNIRQITMPADNAAWTITDLEAQSLVGVIPVGTYYASALNSLGIATNVGLAYRCAPGDTAVYAALVTRGTPTYTATTDLTLTLVIGQD